MSETWTAPESGWYAIDPGEPGGFRRLSDEEVATFGDPPEGDLVLFETTAAGSEVYSAVPRHITLPNNLSVQQYTWTDVNPQTGKL